MTGTDTHTDPSQVEAAHVAEQHGVNPATGLSTTEAAGRLEADGPNALRQKPAEPLWRKVLRQFQDPLVYLLLVAMVISLAAWLAEGEGGWPIDVIVIGIIVIANAVIGFVQERKAADAVAALASMTAVMSTVLREGRLESVASRDLVKGDILALSEGDSVGADARLLTATGLRIQESSLTGESEAVDKGTDVLSGRTAIGDRRNMVFKGTAVVQGVGRAVVTSTGMDTEMGAIADMLDRTESEPSPLQKEVALVSKTLGIAVIVIAVVVMVALVLINGVESAQDLVTILLLGVSLAVAAVPEGLPAILSLVLAIGVQALAKRNAVMKDLHSVETLGSASVICSDKTGTLTRNEMTLRTVVTASGELDLSGTGYRPEGGVVGDPSEDALFEARTVLVGGSLANNAELRQADDWDIQGDPTEAAFLVAQHKFDGAPERVQAYERLAEVPFTSERKMMSVLNKENSTGTRRLFSKGAPDVLLTRCTSVQVGGGMIPLDEEQRAVISASVDRLSSEGYRTLAVAHRNLDDEPGDDVDGSAEECLIFVGVVGIMDPPREEAAAAIREAHRAGIRTVMITGDHPVTAARIAADLGLAEPGAVALTGAQLDELDEDGFRQATRVTSIYARVAPEHKLRIVDALRADRQVVAMTGDGVNDAPALKAADIGVAMGITGTEVTKEAATMILADDNYATIVAAVRQGRAIFDNIRKFLRYLLSSNMGEVTTVFFGVVLAGVLGIEDAATAGAIAVPLLATQILWINLVTDSGPALAMGVDPEDGDVMARSPRGPGDRIIDRHMWQRVGFIGVVMGAVTLLTIDMFLPGGLIEGSDSLTVARTAGFTTLVFAQLFNALNARSETTSAFTGLFTNKWLWASIVLGVVLQVAVVEIPFLQVAFGTASLDLAHWAMATAMASVVLWAEELVKLVRRLRGRR
ncbi:cation-translocating P-type ATPase [Tessaracoccus antarcticus]|uniref:Cation-translocating P-type ATPase n=1 Tax=Tessaracoccus antarcticus TaxID=2479848 RepID=A0A3M0GAV4_9ACTN|nr:cation-translocating P-type ATPase [Tessaracoccus antarcticus]RMB59622.1 cation-translocating P-type ATPase [Tessaracoccus antarcticus]